MSKGWLRTAGVLLFMAIPLAAQTEEPGGKKKTPPRHVRFLAMGEAPPFRQEIRDGVRYELEPPEGSIPPRDVVLGLGDPKEDAKEKPEPAKLSLDRISSPSAIPDGAGPLELRKKNAAGDTKAWMTVQRPEHGDLLVLLWRNPRGKNWDSVESLVVPDGPEAMPSRNVLLLNVAAVSIGATFGTEKLTLNYRQPVLKTPEARQELPIEISAPSPDPKTPGKRFFSSVLAINEGESTRVIVYRADGEKPRSPVKVLILREPVTPEKP